VSLSAEFMTRLAVMEDDELAGTWNLTQPLIYRSQILGETVTVPEGFRTDFASVPRLPLVYLAAGGKGERAAVVHDWLYSTQSVERATADAVLQEALLACGYSRLLATAFYTAVRAFGGSHWKAPNQPQPAHIAPLMADAA
jgi:hypothetical protein